MNYRLLIDDRKYTSWSWIIEETKTQYAEIPPDWKPHKQFSKDIILYDHHTNTTKTVFSHIRSQIPVAGILVLDGNRTFGRTTKNKKLLYKCIPDDKHLPYFLIPYEPTIQFSKVLKNKYVVFQFDHWNEQHPHGKLLSTIGDVDHLDAFYEYQLHCKSLHISINKFANTTQEQLKTSTQEDYIQQILDHPDLHIEDRRKTSHPFTIDPEHSTDFDDAFSILIDPLTKNTHITIYIANVYVWLDTLHLWKSFTDRVSTIYLPDRKRPMLPTILSDNLCSLRELEPRFAFAMDLVFSPENDLIHTSIHQVLITVTKNYRYEEPHLLAHPEYNTLYDITKNLDTTISDSHDVVAYWMIRMNTICGTLMADKNIGIFRQAIFSKPTQELPDSACLSTSAKRTISTWNNTSGQYVIPKSAEYENVRHDVMKLANYTHITSPIRRLVDLLNQMWMLDAFGLETNRSKEATEFFYYWIRRLEYINTSMRSIRKVQTDCELLHRCITDKSLMENHHEGILFDKLQKNDGGFIYMVYLEKLNMLSRLKTYVERDNYSKHQFQLFLFVDENSLKQKIRVQII
jgi:exoribonuclease R